MVISSILAMLLGVTLGLRYRVLILVPASMLVLAVAATTAVTMTIPWDQAAGAIASEILLLQAGYVLGLAVHQVMRRWVLTDKTRADLRTTR